MYTPVLLASTLLLVTSPTWAIYSLVREYSGQQFFDGWIFADGYDNTTNGAVNWLNETAAKAENLTFFSSRGNPVIKVDDTKNLPNATTFEGQLKRDSVSLTSSDFYGIGSVFIIDIVHVPFGCSVWPAFWTRGLDWPHDGEIDILESVNIRSFNQMALHADPGCVQPPGVLQLGKTTGTDCSAGRNSSIGCAVQETKPNSFGAGFNDAGGGVFATQFDVAGIFIWFWSRNDIPDSVKGASDAIDTTSWGTPSAAWPASGCDPSKYFKAQQLVLDITLCGDFAGDPGVYGSSGCVKPNDPRPITPNTCYTDNVNGTGANFAEAYFEISYVKVYSVNDSVLTPTVSGDSTVLATATSSSTPTSAAGGSASTDTSSGDGTNAATTAISAPSFAVSAFYTTFGAVLFWSLM